MERFDKVAEKLPAPKVEREMTATDAIEPFSIGRNQFLMYIRREVLLHRILSIITGPFTSARRSQGNLGRL